MPVSRRMKPKFRERNRKRKEQKKQRSHKYMYNNTVFASMLEVAWAAFFDKMGIEWEYEPRLIFLNNGQPYPPDFYLPAYRVYVECKGVEGGSWKDPRLSDKLEQTVEKTAHPVLLLQGSPQRAILNVGRDTGISAFLPSPIGVFVASDMTIAKCKICKKLVFFRTSPNRVTLAPCHCGSSWPAELEAYSATEIEEFIRKSLNDDDFGVF